MLVASTIVKIYGKLFKVMEISEFGAKVQPIKKISRNKYNNDGKAYFISANTDAKVIK
jgi:hypothetical protein